MHTELGKAAEIPATTLAVARQTFVQEECYTPSVEKKADDETILVTDSPEFAEFFHTTYWAN